MSRKIQRIRIGEVARGAAPHVSGMSRSRPDGGVAAAPFALRTKGTNMSASHDHRLHALEMLLRSMRTGDPGLRASFERLSADWLAIAHRRERLESLAASAFMPGPIGAWRPIDTAPRQQEILVTASSWGPRIWLRDEAHATRGRWRVEGAASALEHDRRASRDARWEDLDGEPLAFAPTEWREIDA